MDARIRPIDFSADVARLTRHFVRRSHIDERAEAWLEGPKPLLLLIGRPGSGKSTIAARLFTRSDVLTVSHFCLTGRSSTINPGTTLRSLAAQLTLVAPGFDLTLANTIAPHLLTVQVDLKIGSMSGGEAAGVIINNFHSPDPVEELEALIGRPLRAMPPPDGRKLIIIIDGLDEAVGQGVALPLPMLVGRLVDLPPWVRVFCTSRPDQRVLSHFDEIATVRLDLDTAESGEDVRAYALARLATLGQPADANFAAAVRIEAAAQGNFLVARTLLDEIEAGDRASDDEDFPSTLDETYRRYLRRFSDEEWRDFIQPVLGTLSVALEPLHEAELADLAGIAATNLRRHLGVLQQFLVVYDQPGGDLRERTFRIYHQAFREFLLDGRINLEFWCAASDQHRRIADYYETTVPLSKRIRSGATPYYWMHFVRHLQESGEPLCRVCTYLFNGDWLLDKLKATSVEALITDFRQLSALASEALVIAAAIRQSANVLQEAPEQLSSHLCGRLADRGDAFLEDFVARLSATTSYAWLQPMAECLARADGPLRLTIPVGVKSAIESVAIALDGSWALAACGKELIAVDLESGRLLYRLSGHEREIHSAAMDAAGHRAISSGADDTVRIWDLSTRTELFCFACQTDQNADVAVVLDVGIAHDSGRWRAWSVTTGEEVAAPPGGGEFLVARGEFAIVEAAGGANVVWSVIQGGRGHRLQDSDLDAADLREDGQMAVLLRKGKLFLREVTTGRLVRQWGAEDDGKSYHLVAFLRGGTEIISVSGPYEAESPTVNVWRAETGECVRTLLGHHTMVTAMATLYLGSLCVTGTIDGELKVWDLDRESVTHRPGHAGPVNSVAFVQAGAQLLSGGQDGRLIVWDTASAEGLRVMTAESPIVSLAAVDAEVFAMASKRGDIALRRLDTLDKRSSWGGLGRAFAVCPSPSDDTLYVLSSEGVTQWDRAGRALGGWALPLNFDGLPMPGGIGPVPVVMTILPGTPRAVIGYGSGDAHLSDDWQFPAIVVDFAARAVPTAIFQLGAPGKTAAAWMDDGRFALTAHKNIEIWDTGTGEVVDKFGHPGDVAAIAALADRDLGVSVCSDGVVRLWRLSTRRTIAEVRLDESATCCAIATDASAVAVGDRIGGVHLFRISGLSQ